jgi:hypothetical protein
LKRLKTALARRRDRALGSLLNGIDRFAESGRPCQPDEAKQRNKHPDLPREQVGHDFSVGCLQFRSGVVARLTCGIVAPHDHSLRIIGDKGVLGRRVLA